jgi:thiol-disulfide isomerase/thioredoxin
MKHALAALCLAVATVCGPALAAKPNLPSTNVDWVSAASDTDVDRAFAQAKAARKPLLLYWGATWCPPCNQLKATLFNRQEFAAEARAFVAVHVDGDRPGAQRLGQRFKVSGYPTMVLFNADGGEITRLPGEVEPPQVLALMQLGMGGGRPVKAVLADALAARPLSANEWRLLAFYSWETDETQLVPKGQLAATLAKLAQASPADDGETTTRLWLKALAASDDDKEQGLKPDAALRERVQKVLADPALARTHMNVIVGAAPDLVRALASDGPPERSPMLPAFESALQRLQADATLSRADRQSALIARIELARLAQPKDTTQPQLPEALLKDVRDMAARNDREITDGYERMAVVTGDGYMLGRAGLWTESDTLLKANLTKSHSPYYLMSQLGGNAKKLGRKDEALKWFEQAWEKSEGPATRLQWGSRYLGELVDLAPAEGLRIEKAASRILGEAGRDAGAFEGRSARSLERVGKKLVAWNADGRHAASMKRLQAQLDGVCGKVGGSDRATCQQLLKPKKAA